MTVHPVANEMLERLVVIEDDLVTLKNGDNHSVRCNQPTIFFSHAKPATAISQPAVLFLTTNQHQPLATAQQTE